MLLLRAAKSIFYDLGLKRKFGSWILKLQSAFFDFLLKKCFLTNLKTDENWLFLLIDCTNYKKNFLPIDCKTTNPELGISRKTDFMHPDICASDLSVFKIFDLFWKIFYKSSEQMSGRNWKICEKSKILSKIEKFFKNRKIREKLKNS